ncbi:hypothetical protein J7T55_011444 [Diaporthe amygdali]|uniref:uncharacterized protein n=1 Tax=Phomopsis amygdali TaxID=1214568 RepID=UPI0022FEFAA3|nr:uncharacterized protein J7T55_011444 [Diaporthe amygdali]KAJ0122983.1 hypothetical protein J7T55_011444 [Diaporthe amygdali]
MDNHLSQNYITQVRRLQSTETASFKAKESAEDPFADGSGQSQASQPATDPRRVRKDEVMKPWVKEPRDATEKRIEFIPLIGLLVGIAIAGILIWDGLRNVVEHKYCTVLTEDWSRGLRPDVWQPEIQVGGFGNGEFEETTDAPENLYVKGGNLFIKATLRDDSEITKDSIVDLGSRCTGKEYYNCIAATNTAPGNSSIVPPVFSARINTKNSAKIKYGRVEVVAKMPKGDWLWPAIWMMPVNDTYGPWPASGEIDIAESRGNNHTHPQGGNNAVSSALHWGPDTDTDRWWQTFKKRTARHSVYSEGFNTFGVEWSQKYLFTYLNNRLMMVMYTPFAKSMWKRGKFPYANSNGTALQDPWSQTGRDNTPFDQEFYLILNLAVGGTNGWFKDGKSGKPWLDTSKNAPKEFWEARHSWFPTWTQPYMEVKKVTILQQCDGDEHLGHKLE